MNNDSGRIRRQREYTVNIWAKRREDNKCNVIVMNAYTVYCLESA